ncbi:hypothetical protein [Leptospira fletcheri]|uniref:hypothetical protein n=1 Tax=Leptospira fletcheri TaxID=2484981 RepID=UPI00319DED3B
MVLKLNEGFPFGSSTTTTAEVGVPDPPLPFWLLPELEFPEEDEPEEDESPPAVFPE